MKYLIMIAAGVAAASTASAQYLPYVSYDFDTPTTPTGVSVRKAATAAQDSDALFGYNFSTYTRNPLYTGPVTIPQSPNAATSATGALRLRANFNPNDANADGINVFLTTTALTQFRLTFDLYMNYNGPAFGGSASTEFFLSGIGDGTRCEWVNGLASLGSSGWHITQSGESGAGQDWRYYEGQGPTTAHLGNTTARPAPATNYNGIPNWLGQFNLGQDSNTTTWAQVLSPPTYETTGTASKNWATYSIEVNGSSVTVFLDPVTTTPSAIGRTQIGSWTTVSGAGNAIPFVGYMDIFTGAMTDPANRGPEQFALVDNVKIEVPLVPAIAREWQLYE